ncbi:MAG: methyltransferase [Burkholderiaceae bacterium]
MKLLESAEDVSEIAFGFMASKALFAALHLRLFNCLAEGELTAAEAATAMDIHPDRATTLLTALTTLGLVARSEQGRYRNSPAADAFLVKGAKYDFGDYLRLQVDRQMYGLLDQIDDAIADNLPDEAISSYAEWMADPEAARLYSDSQHAGSLGPARGLARAVDLSGARSLLDVGGGTGAFAITLCQANPSLQVTVIDFPNVAKLGEEYVRKAGLEKRIRFVPGDLLKLKWPQGHDVVLMSYIFSSVPGEKIPDLIRQAHAVLQPGARLLVHDFMVGPDRHGPKLAALWQFQHTAFNPHARSVATDWAATQIAKAGFVDVKVDEMIPGMTSLAVARKPA